jgi:hypothetical protein
LQQILRRGLEQAANTPQPLSVKTRAAWNRNFRTSQQRRLSLALADTRRVPLTEPLKEVITQRHRNVFFRRMEGDYNFRFGENSQLLALTPEFVISTTKKDDHGEVGVRNRWRGKRVSVEYPLESVSVRSKGRDKSEVAGDDRVRCKRSADLHGEKGRQ